VSKDDKTIIGDIGAYTGELRKLMYAADALRAFDQLVTTQKTTV
jgi:hypothetical protein